MNNVLTYMTFIPVAGAAIVLALPNNAKLIRWVSAAATVPPLLMAIWLFKNFDRAKAAADRIRQPEVRLRAYLDIAQQTIMGAPK